MVRRSERGANVLVLKQRSVAVGKGTLSVPLPAAMQGLVEPRDSPDLWGTIYSKRPMRSKIGRPWTENAWC